jgi:type I restriction enzyme, S subunit
VIHRLPVDPWFLGIALLDRESEIEALGEGSTGQTELSRARLGELLCPVPPADFQRTFGRLVAPLFSRLAANERESRTVATLRDTLLPKLISGELRVKDAKQQVEAAI